MSLPVIITDKQVKNVLNWPLVNEAVEEAFKSICNTERSNYDKNKSFADQPTRSRTLIENQSGILFTMPGYVGNYTLNSKKFNTLGCKMVTMFQANEKRNPPLPSILANITLFNSETGQLECIMDGTEITAWRTASASIVSTKYLYFKRKQSIEEQPIVAIIGCGVQGKSHSFGLCHTFDLSEIRLWNRTEDKITTLANLLEKNKANFINKNIKIKKMSNIIDCVKDADIIVTSTYVDKPIIELDMLKKNVHINAVGCGPKSHHAELSQDIYDNCSLYIDHWAGYKTELKDLKTNVIGTVGDAIIDEKNIPEKGISVFQSLGMAVEDVTVAQSIYEVIKNENP